MTSMFWTVFFVLINEEHVFLVFIIINIFLSSIFFSYIVFARLQLVDKKGGGNNHLLLY